MDFVLVNFTAHTQCFVFFKNDFHYFTIQIKTSFYLCAVDNILYLKVNNMSLWYNKYV